VFRSCLQGAASFFGIHFTPENVTDYKSAVSGDQNLRRRLFFGLLREGILLQANCSGSLNILTTETHVGHLVEAVKRVASNIRM
jgi:glutamate-1-semialdehyde aminotransferase